jgi:uncharacterized protein YjdB
VTSLRPEADRADFPRPLWLARGLAILLALTCLFAPAPLSAQAANEVQVTPETMTLAVGQRQPIFATAYDRQGNLLASAKFAFSSSDTAVARVASDGTVLGVAPGLAKIEARILGKRASLAVLITGGTAGPSANAAIGSALTLEPTAAMLLPGENVQITPQALREDGSPLAVGQVLWKSLKPEVATVDTGGIVLGVAPGKSIVQASTRTGLMATVPVEVEPAEIALSGGTDALGPEEAETLHVRVPSQNNREVTGGVQWRSADTNVAVVGPTGIVLARTPGRAEIIAAGFGQERRASVVVHRLAQTLVVTPKPTAEPLQVPARASRKFSAVAEAADSSLIPEVHIVWEIGDSARAGFDPRTGTLTTRDTGVTTLTARLRGFEPVVWRIQVVPGILALSRSRAGIKLGERLTVGANLLDDQGKVVGPAPGIQWASDRPEVAAVSAGEIRGVGPGHATLTATAPWGKADSADIYVTADLLVASNRSGAFGLYQLRTESSDTLLPLLVDGGGNVQGMRSPDRTRIAFSSSRGGSFDLYVMDADGRNARRLTLDPGNESEPVWTPDGTRIVYTAAPRGGIPQLVSVRADGTDPRPLTASAGGNRAADVSPDGRRIAFVSTRDGNPEIYEMDADGGEAKRITRTGDHEAAPHYLPNGDLVFLVDKGNRARLMRLPAGAATPLPLLEIDQSVSALDIAPDGERIAYVAGRIAESEKGKSQLTLRIQPLAAGSTAVLIPLRPGERVLSLSF